MIHTITRERMLEISNQVSGRYIDVDGAFGNQCWDSAAHIQQLLGLPTISTGGPGRWPGWAGNMWDAFPQSPEIDGAYYLVGPDKPALPGDTAIWGDSYYYYPATHVATVMSDAGIGLVCLSQNSSPGQPWVPGYSPKSSGPTIIQALPKDGLLGYIRPRTTGNINPQGNIKPIQEDEMSAADVTAIITKLDENRRHIFTVHETVGNTKKDVATVHNSVLAVKDIAVATLNQANAVRADVATVHHTIIQDVGSQLGQIAGRQIASEELLRQVLTASGKEVDWDKLREVTEQGTAKAIEASVASLNAGFASNARSIESAAQDTLVLVEKFKQGELTAAPEALPIVGK